MKIYLECVPCIINNVISLGRRLNVEEEKIEKILKELLTDILESNFEKSAPEYTKVAYKFIKKHTGIDDPYKDIKFSCNNEILKIADKLKEVLNANENSFLAGVKLAILGNIIDFGAKSDFKIETIFEKLEKINTLKLAIDDVKSLQNKLQNAKTLLYIGDNCGEIVFDKIFIQEIKKNYPNLKITFAHRGFPVLNDSTKDDVLQVGLDKIVDIIGTGDNTPGVLLQDTSQEFKNIFETSEVIISKGQGNFETLYNGKDIKGKLIYFMFMVKCQVFEKLLNLEKHSLICMKNDIV